MTKEYLVNACPNPLCFFEADDSWSRLLKANVTSDHVLKYACASDESTAIDEIVGRYREISSEAADLLAAPAETKILQKIGMATATCEDSLYAWELSRDYRHVRIGCRDGIGIALEISNVRINNKRLEPKEQAALFGSSFENLGQQRRVEVLFAYGLIDDAMKTKLDVVRVKRKRYLHFWSEEHGQSPKDAVAVYNATVSLVAKVMGQDFRDGKLLLNPALVAYLRRAGVLQDREPEGNAES